MTQHLLQVNFRFDMSKQDYETGASFIAGKFASVPGLVWKIWLMNEDRKEAGGIYLFQDKKMLEAFKNSELFKAMATKEGFSVISVKDFEMLENASLVTNAPLYPFSLISKTVAVI